MRVTQLQLINLMKQLLPQGGNAFRLPMPEEAILAYGTEDGTAIYGTEDGTATYSTEDGRVDSNGILYRLIRAITVELLRDIADIDNIADCQLPDNNNFTMQDAIDWYRRLGIYNSGAVSFEDMKAAIRQKMSFPATPTDRQSALYISAQLYYAGFTDVRIVPNSVTFGSQYFYPFTLSDWATLAGLIGIVGEAYCGACECGDVECGGDLSQNGLTKIVSYIEEDKDMLFNLVPDYRRMFLVAGLAAGINYGTVPIGRKEEFRQLLLKLKKADLVGVLFVNYV